MPQKSPVQPKKHLGQHFLTDLNIAQQIAQTLSLCGYKQVLEIGPGTGVLTQFLLEKDAEVFVIEIDKESVAYLQAYFPKLKGHILSEDFLKFDIVSYFNKTPFAIIGNFPYNISSQIVFKLLEIRFFVPEFAGMFQKEGGETMVNIIAEVLRRTNQRQYFFHNPLVLWYYFLQAICLKAFPGNDVEVFPERESPQIVAFNNAVQFWIFVFKSHNTRPREDNLQLWVPVVALTQFRTPIGLLENLVDEQHLSAVINEVGCKVCDASALEIEVVHVDIQALPVALCKILFGIL